MSLSQTEKNFGLTEETKRQLLHNRDIIANPAEAVTAVNSFFYWGCPATLVIPAAALMNTGLAKTHSELGTNAPIAALTL